MSTFGVGTRRFQAASAGTRACGGEVAAALTSPPHTTGPRVRGLLTSEGSSADQTLLHGLTVRPLAKCGTSQQPEERSPPGVFLRPPAPKAPKPLRLAIP